jgi:hypothetical protein
MIRFLPLCWLLLPLALGCGESDSRRAAVHGRVFFKGELLRTGTIVFVPDSDRGGHGPIACAEIQPDGSYTLQTGDQVGAVPGWHRVTVVAVEPVALADGPRRFPEHRSLLPPRYRDPELSGLSFQVKADEDNLIDLHLE